MAVSQAKVKSVLSGDTLVLVSVNNPNQERTLSLAFVSAPRLRREGDEVSERFLQQVAGTHTLSDMWWWYFTTRERQMNDRGSGCGILSVRLY